MRARGIVPGRVLEPTCGSGAFLEAAARTFPAAELAGIEYQRERYAAALGALQRARPQLALHYANAYEFAFDELPWRADGPLVVLGNPPWITAAALGRVGGDVVQPPRSNPKALRGLAARTGAANFDVAEFLILKLLRDLRAVPLHVALLVKESVARSVIAAAAAGGMPFAHAEIVRIDARRWFGVAVDACCFIVTTPARPAEAQPAVVLRTGFDGAAARFAPLSSPARPMPSVFRQGIKHDAADVFELHAAAGGWHNGYGEPVDIEPEHVYPLLKARALHAGEPCGSTALVVPQARLGAATDVLAARAPRLWRYLNAHAERIAARKSSIYRNAPQFALFGVGPYSFAPWKVAVAGLYARPQFRVVGPHAGKPVVFGDTAYFASFEAEADARAFAALCRAPATAAHIAAHVFGGKRPITKALLDTIDQSTPAAAMTDASERFPARLAEGAAV